MRRDSTTVTCIHNNDACIQEYITGMQSQRVCIIRRLTLRKAAASGPTKGVVMPRNLPLAGDSDSCIQDLKMKMHEGKVMHYNTY